MGSGNRIVTDGWSIYDFLEHHLSGYRRYKHIYGRRYGVQSTSHIESIWAQIQSKLKENYHTIPHKNFMNFIREIEFRIKIILSTDAKIKMFFDCFNTCQNVDDKDINMTDINNLSSLNISNLNESEDESE